MTTLETTTADITNFVAMEDEDITILLEGKKPTDCPVCEGRGKRFYFDGRLDKCDCCEDGVTRAALDRPNVGYVNPYAKAERIRRQEEEGALPF